MSYKEDGASLFPKDANGEFVDGGVDYLDTWKAMEKLVDAGLVKSIGVSNFNAKQIDRVVANGNFIFFLWRETTFFAMEVTFTLAALLCFTMNKKRSNGDEIFIDVFFRYSTNPSGH